MLRRQKYVLSQSTTPFRVHLSASQEPLLRRVLSLTTALIFDHLRQYNSKVSAATRDS